MITPWLMIAALVGCIAKSSWNITEDDVIQAEVQYLTNSIVSTYFSEARCIGVFTETLDTYIRVSDLPAFYITLNRSNVTVDNLLLSAIDAGCLAFILQVSDVIWMVEKFSELFRSPASHYRANRRYLYLPQDFEEDDDGNWETLISDVFSCKSMNWMPDLLIINAITRKASRELNSFKQSERSRGDGNESDELHIPNEVSFLLEVYTHRFVGETPSEKVFVDAWVPDHGFLYGVNLYYDKVHNLMGKELKIAGTDYPPYSIMKMDTDPAIFDGIEFQIMFEFGKKSNITWKLFCDLENFWGEIWENGSGNDIMGDTAADRVDFGLSALSLWLTEYLHLDYSVVYFFSGLTAVTPKPKLLSAWLLPVRPFNIHMWIAVLTSVIIITTILYATTKASQTLLGGGIHSRYSTLTECGFRTAGLLVLQVPDDERDYATPRYVPMRHLVSWFALFFLVVSSAYGGGLSFILTLPQFEPPIDTAKELADSGLLWYGVDPSYTYTFIFSSDPIMKTLTRNFVVRPKEELVKLAVEDVALAVERTQGGHFADVNVFTEEMMKSKRIMKEDIIYTAIVFSLRKGSPYKETFNSMLSRLRESGLPSFWEGMVVRKYHRQRLQQSVIGSGAAPEVQRTKLSFSHIQGAFYILGFGLFLASLTLMMEFLRFRHVGKKRGIKESYTFSDAQN